MLVRPSIRHASSPADPVLRKILKQALGDENTGDTYWGRDTYLIFPKSCDLINF